MIPRTHTLLGLSLAAGLALASSCAFPAQGALLIPGGFVAPLPGDTPVSGTLVAQLVSPFFGSNGKYAGTLTSAVWANDGANPYSGGLTYQYTVANNSVSIDAIERLTLIGWTDTQTDVGYVLGGGVAAAYADRSNDGDTVGFTWAKWIGTIAPGASGSVFIRSDAAAYTTSIANIIDGGIADAATFAPAPVPEPTTLLAGALLLLPFGASAVRILRKNKTS
jgi:hypothetical protein